MNATPRCAGSGPLTALSASVNAAAATCGAAPRPGTGSPRWKKPDSCTISPCSPAASARSPGFLMRDSSWRGSLGDLRVGLLLRQLFLDLLPHLVERTRLARLLLDDADDVEAELRAHEIARLARLHRKRGGLELGHHAAPAEEAEVAAVGLRALVFGFLLRQRREIARRPSPAPAALRRACAPPLRPCRRS